MHPPPHSRDAPVPGSQGSWFVGHARARGPVAFSGECGARDTVRFHVTRAPRRASVESGETRFSDGSAFYETTCHRSRRKLKFVFQFYYFAVHFRGPRLFPHSPRATPAFHRKAEGRVASQATEDAWALDLTPPRSFKSLTPVVPLRYLPGANLHLYPFPCPSDRTGRHDPPPPRVLCVPARSPKSPDRQGGIPRLTPTLFHQPPRRTPPPKHPRLFPLCGALRDSRAPPQSDQPPLRRRYGRWEGLAPLLIQRTSAEYRWFPTRQGRPRTAREVVRRACARKVAPGEPARSMAPITRRARVSSAAATAPSLRRRRSALNPVHLCYIALCANSQLFHFLSY